MAVPPPPERSDVLDLEARRRVVEYVAQHPGLHLRGLAEALGMPLSTLEYHCYQLVRHGRLSTRQDAGFKAFYPGEGMDRRDKDILYVVRHEVPRRVCTHLALHPGATPKDLKGATGLGGPTLSFHLKKLRGAGIIVEEPAGRTKLLYLRERERVASLLVTYRGSFLDDAVDRFARIWTDLAGGRPGGDGGSEEATGPGDVPTDPEGSDGPDGGDMGDADARSAARASEGSRHAKEPDGRKGRT